MIASFGFFYGRRIFLDMVAGGFKNDLEALGDPTPDDERCARLTEYTSIILRLLQSAALVSLEGRYYTISRVAMKPALPEHLRPGILLSGSSPAGQAAARELARLRSNTPNPATTKPRRDPPRGPVPAFASASSPTGMETVRGRSPASAFPRTGAGRSISSLR